MAISLERFSRWRCQPSCISKCWKCSLSTVRSVVTEIFSY